MLSILSVIVQNPMHQRGIELNFKHYFIADKATYITEQAGPLWSWRGERFLEGSREFPLYT